MKNLCSNKKRERFYVENTVKLARKATKLHVYECILTIQIVLYYKLWRKNPLTYSYNKNNIGIPWRAKSHPPDATWAWHRRCSGRDNCCGNARPLALTCLIDTFLTIEECSNWTRTSFNTWSSAAPCSQFLAILWSLLACGGQTDVGKVATSVLTRSTAR